jgi:potassium efflux system protein
MRTLRRLFFAVGDTAIWPAFLTLGAYTIRQSPLPRSLAVVGGTALVLLALAWFLTNVVRWVLREGGPAESVLGMPAEVTKQLRWATLTLIAAQVVLLLPCWLLSRGLVTSNGRPVIASTIVRLLILAFEVGVFGVVFRVVRSRSALMRWIGESPDRLRGLPRWRGAIGLAMLAGIASVIVLEVRGYSFSARRLSNGTAATLIAMIACLLVYRAISRAIGKHSWRWVKSGENASDDANPPDDLARRLRLLSAYAVGVLGLFLGAWIWDIDLALFRFISEQNLWTVDGAKEIYVTVGDLTKAVVVATVCAIAWKHMSAFFAVAVFPRMPDDPGVRFAVLTLCRYVVLGVGLLGVLSMIHLGLEKIGVVLAALGVGLGFGLQEIVSNFVCGIILLLERPIRVGDIVTVSNMTGKIDRINIRATTITNGDNQSIIVPNRAFITGDLVNWTLKDKVVRVTIKVQVALGTDPDRVAEIFSAIARDDSDILLNPVPSALVEEFSTSAMQFVMHVHVPDPSLAGRVKHRLIGEIQRRFREAGIAIALPTQELHVKGFDPRTLSPFSHSVDSYRFDTSSPTPPAPRLSTTAPIHTPEPVEDCHRGVDE